MSCTVRLSFTQRLRSGHSSASRVKLQAQNSTLAEAAAGPELAPRSCPPVVAVGSDAAFDMRSSAAALAALCWEKYDPSHACRVAAQSRGRAASTRVLGRSCGGLTACDVICEGRHVSTRRTGMMITLTRLVMPLLGGTQS